MRHPSYRAGPRRPSNSPPLIAAVLVLLFAGGFGSLVVVGAPGFRSSSLPVGPAESRVATPAASLAPIEPVHVSKHTPTTERAFAVDPNASYSSEPAPMGIADFGVTPGGSGYAYASPLIQGTVTIRSLYVSSTAAANSLSFQLNVEDIVTSGSSTYIYWIQDVAFFDTNLHGIFWEDNVWNLTQGLGTGLPGTSLAGNGSTYSGTFYADGASGYPGSNVSLSQPATFTARVVASNASGIPHVGFEYSDGYGWVTYDNVTFPFLTNGVNRGFLVDGTQYLPGGQGFFDAEWVMGGPGGGSSQATVRADVNMSLAYWNGHNLQLVRSAWNHGANTGETISNVREGLAASSASDSLAAHIANGSGVLGVIYGPTSSSTLRVAVPALSIGNLTVNGVAVPYRGGVANLTLPPGAFEVELWLNGSVQAWANVSLVAGEFRAIQLNPFAYFPVTFRSSNLPSGIPWSVSLGGQNLTGTGAVLTTAARNGSYTYLVGGVPGYQLANYFGSVQVAGGALEVDLVWVQTVYQVTFVAQNFVANTSWNVTVDGQLLSSTSSSLLVTLPNGTFAFVVGVSAGVSVTPSADNLTVAGANTVAYVAFSLASAEIRGTVTPGTARILVDGIVATVSFGAFAVTVGPGPYSLVASASGYTTRTWNGTISGGATVTLSLALNQSTSGTTPGGSGSSGFFGLSGSTIALLVVVAVAALLVVLVVVLRRPRARR
ncbi:MAG: thermopsin family protease [Thermoplasmata archaeon]|nr:thermopsin family protease [Thermoplasmata archaeon]MCI4355557.1 thermopsin family protease [Thermoplasmata archaeon]